MTCVCRGGYSYGQREGYAFSTFVSAIGQPGFHVYFKLDRESTRYEIVAIPLIDA